MTTPILMPALSPTMEEGTLARWLVGEGDIVSAGDVIAEIETDKATMDFEADTEGLLEAILVPEGTPGVKVNTPIATLRDAASATGADAPPKAAPARPAAPSRRAPDPDPGRRTTMREALHDALAEEMRRDDAVFLIGEEVGTAQGAYKVSQGLIDLFGAARIVDAPVTPHALAGLGVGAAFAGLRPVVEFMNWSFALQALDQIVNSAAKARYRTGGRLTCPIVFRGPHGPAPRVGAQHSQDLAAWFAHVPGLKVAMPYSADDAKGLLKAAIRDPDPVLLLESEALYGQAAPVPEGDDHLVALGSARVRRSGGDVTLVGCGAAMTAILAAADTLAAQDIAAEVIDLRSLRPLDTDAVAASVRKTGRCVTVEQGWPACAIGTTIAAALMRDAFDWLDAPVATLTGADAPMPYAAGLESLALPTPERIVEAARAACYR